MISVTYLDNAASTQLHPDVLDAMLPYLQNLYGNPSSIHRNGRMAKKAMHNARRQIAFLINADPLEIFFTSGGTESNNLALDGFVKQTPNHTPCRIITSTIEHDAVLEPCKNLTDTNTTTVDYLPVDKYGLVDIDKLARLLGVSKDTHVPDQHQHQHQQFESSQSVGLLSSKSPVSFPLPFTLVSIMYANNEIGAIQPISDIVQLCRKAGAFFHTDAVQAVGKVPIDVKKLGIDMMSISSHKIHGPKGVGALYVRRGMQLAPRILGGGQERGMRSGTEHVAGIVGFGVACEIARKNLEHNMSHTRTLRDILARRILDEIPYSIMNGSQTARLPGNVHFTFFGISGEDLLIKLDEHGIAASTGSACSVNRQKASHVLQAMGFTHEQIAGSLRLTLGMFNTIDEIHHTVNVLKEIVHELRAVSPFKSKYVFDNVANG